MPNMTKNISAYIFICLALLLLLLMVIFIVIWTVQIAIYAFHILPWHTAFAIIVFMFYVANRLVLDRND